MEIEFTPEAENDLAEALEYYNGINPSLPLKFLDRIEESKQIILNSEKGFEVKYRNVRTVLIKPFPYHLHYILEERKIVIIAILHSHINPKRYL